MTTCVLVKEKQKTSINRIVSTRLEKQLKLLMPTGYIHTRRQQEKDSRRVIWVGKGPEKRNRDIERREQITVEAEVVLS